MLNERYWGLQRFFILLAPVVTLAVTPEVTQDPINVIKLLILSIGGLGSLGSVIWILRNDLDRISKKTTMFFMLFVFALTITFVFSGTSKTQSFFGASGRNTGYLAYLSLALIALTVSTIVDERFLSRITVSLFATGLVSLFYSLLQNFGSDPFPWVNPNNPMIGFLGNSNFNSSFLGIFCIISFALLLSSVKSKKSSLLLMPIILLTIVAIYLTNSIQGLIVVAIGFILMLLFIAISKGKSQAVITLSSFSLLSGILGILGLINRGPLAPFIFGDTLIFRRDYWLAGMKMTVEHPIMGIGLDNYGDWYRRSRTIEATLRRGPDVTTNAAHNVFLDLSSNGGIVLLIPYLALIYITLVSIKRILKFGQNSNYLILGVISAWFAFQAQALISINQIGLAIWGWIMMGIIIGYDQFMGRQNLEGVIKKTKVSKNQQLPAGLLVSLFLGSLLGFASAVPVVIADARVQTSFEIGDPQKLSQAAQQWPQNPISMARIAAILRENKLDSLALKTAQSAVRNFPDSYPAWNELSLATVSGSKENLEALAELKRLDPLNPNLK